MRYKLARENPEWQREVIMQGIERNLLAIKILEAYKDERTN